MKRGFLIIFALCGLMTTLSAQELNLRVHIATPALKVADPKTFEALETAIAEFLNNTTWTEDDYEDHERIEGTLQINIKEDLSTNQFIADFYLQSVRPVYKASYTTPLLNHVDKDVPFSYELLTPIRNNVSGFTDNLSAILTYYAHIILGFDYDSFSPLGGEKYFLIAQNIVSSVTPAAAAADKGWASQSGSRNRYWLVENVLNPRVKPYRIAYYDYHRKSLDVMHNDSGRGRAVMMSSLSQIDKVNDAYRNSMILQMFADSKRDEIVEIFKAANRADRQRVYRIMTNVDPAQASQYGDLKS